MGYAKHIGRVGALAVTLGVGVALASPGVAYADSTESSSSSSTSTSDTGSSPSAGSDATSNGPATSPAADSEPKADDSTDVKEAEKPARGRADTIGTPKRKSADRRTTLRASLTRTEVSSQQSADPGAALAEPKAAKSETTTPTGTEAASVTSVTVASVETANVVPSVKESDPVLETGAIVTIAVSSTDPSAGSDPQTPPVEAPLALAALGAVRDELERNTLSRKATAAPQAAATAAVTAENVLLIGVDGTNLSRVLSDPANLNFFNLIKESSTAPSSIVGHTTISNPSWTSILTGAWGERTGVINNIFTPWTYKNWPTVFNQLEQDHGDGIQTTAIADWDVIAAIAAAGGGLGADLVHYIGKRPDDPNWLKTDDAVGDTTELVIADADPNVANFVFSYFVGVDENGHAHGGASEQYKLAVQNFDRNLGEILAQVTAWEADPANMGEKWTIILVTDHGHQPQLGLGHGFQSPDETETFVVVRGQGFDPRAINLQYEIVDVTPTIVTLFGGTPRPGDGTPMTELHNNVFPLPGDDALRAALLDVIDKNGYPDLVTNVSLGVRTIFTSIPYFLVDIVDGLAGGLKSVAGQNIFLVSFLAGAAVLPVRLIGDLGYVATNFVAQIVARITGVYGASIYPFWPPAAPDFPSYTPPAPPNMLQLCGDPNATGAAQCGVGSIAV
jgi:Type I phosphodiesterase / nucleotide pyrophosphatase